MVLHLVVEEGSGAFGTAEMQAYGNPFDCQGGLFPYADEDVTEELVPMVQADGVGTEEPAHSLDEVGVGRLQNQVEMIPHQAVGMHLPISLLTSFGKRLEKIVPVDIINEYVLLPVAAIHDMIDGSWILNSQRARHGERFARRRDMSSTVKEQDCKQTYGLTPSPAGRVQAVSRAKSCRLVLPRSGKE